MESAADDDLTDWPEGRDGQRVIYRETQPAHWGFWLTAAAMSLSLGIAYGYALGIGAGVLAMAGAGAVCAAILIRIRTVVAVDDRVLRAGEARLPLSYIGAIRALDSEQARRLRGVDADARAHLALRSWMPLAVLVTVLDPRDPHPYWLVSTRDPAAVVAAVAQAQDQQ